MGKRTENIGFICENCGNQVQALDNGGFRNHCPFCLFSRHVDDQLGDRMSDCQGEMVPVGVEFNSKKGLQLIHRCQKCGTIRRNKVAQDSSQDDCRELIFSLMQQEGKLLWPKN